MGNSQEQVYQQWEDKQRAMGRPVPTTTAPHYAKPVTDACADHHTPTRDLDA